MPPLSFGLFDDSSEFVASFDIFVSYTVWLF